MDVRIITYVQTHCHNRITDIIFPLLSRIGNAGAVWLIVAIILGYNRHTRGFAFMLFFSMVLAHIISQILKPIIGRPRPFVQDPGVHLLIHTPGGYSCPSGHSASSFAAATVIWLFSNRFGTAALILALLIAFSRVFLFVHYPSDTFLGSLLGVICAFIVIYLYKL